MHIYPYIESTIKIDEIAMGFSLLMNMSPDNVYNWTEQILNLDWVKYQALW
jgi:hypothetical protein